MPELMKPNVREKGPVSLLNATFIGYMVGTYSVMGKGGAQAIANMAGEYVGREIVAYATSQGKTLDSAPALIAFLKENNLAGEFQFSGDDTQVQVVISDCGICPKRVGKYQFDGTACPWGGILIGTLSAILKQEFAVSAGLTPGASCTITLHVKSSSINQIQEV